MFDSCIQIAWPDLQRARARGLQQIGNNAVNASDLLPYVLDYATGRTCGRKIAPDDFDDSRNASQGISYLVRQACRQLSQGGQVLCARHLRAVQPVNFVAIQSQLLDHAVEISSQIAN